MLNFPSTLRNMYCCIALVGWRAWRKERKSISFSGEGLEEAVSGVCWVFGWKLNWETRSLLWDLWDHEFIVTLFFQTVFVVVFHTCTIRGRDETLSRNAPFILLSFLNLEMLHGQPCLAHGDMYQTSIISSLSIYIQYRDLIRNEFSFNIRETVTLTCS